LNLSPEEVIREFQQNGRRTAGDGAAGVRRTERIKVSDIRGAMCGWAGCASAAPFGGGGLLPEGWRALVVSKYSLLNPAGVLQAEVDMMLCPDHVAMLKRLLK
jgi:hypothetical protein